MSNIALTPEQLRSLPLLRDLTDPQLQQITALLQHVEASPGDVLFEPGDPANAFYLLIAGEVTLYRADQETHLLKPPVLFGELGALTEWTRISRAVVGEGADLWRMDKEALDSLIADNGDIGLLVQRSLLFSSADKIRRDQTRLDDMRRNLIRTQKAMKRMRDFLLESQDTVVSKPLHEILEGLIQQNRRVNYRVAPPTALSAGVRMDSKTKAPVVQISRTHISFSLNDGTLPEPDARVTGVLLLSGPEIPISGKVLRTIERRVDLELDLLIDEYAAALEGYLTRVQMLDSLV